jgi:hypothetical protein
MVYYGIVVNNFNFNFNTQMVMDLLRQEPRRSELAILSHESICTSTKSTSRRETTR